MERWGRAFNSSHIWGLILWNVISVLSKGRCVTAIKACQKLFCLPTIMRFYMLLSVSFRFDFVIVNFWKFVELSDMSKNI